MTSDLQVSEESRGTFACPICGVDVPHPHTESEQKAYHEEQSTTGVAAVTARGIMPLITKALKEKN